MYINMRLLRSDQHGDNEEYQCLSRTPIPILLHVCSETRTLALAYYELTFGQANPPTLLPVFVGFSFNRPESTDPASERFSYTRPETVDPVVEPTGWCNEAEVAMSAPRIYFCFDTDTVVFGRMLIRDRYKGGYCANGQDFPYGSHFGNKLLTRIKKLALCLNPESNSSSWILDQLNRQVGDGSYKALRDLYLCLEEYDLDASQGVELVSVTQKGACEEMPPEFLERWKHVFRKEQPAFDGSGSEGLRNTCQEWVNKRVQLTESMLKNGASPDEVLKCGWIRNRLTKDGKAEIM